MAVLELDGVTKSYADKKVIDDISFNVEAGEIFALLGPNGSGKTTTLRMMLDIIKPDSGSVSVFGGRMNSASKDRIGYLPEERGLYKKAKVMEQLVYLAQLKGVAKKTARDSALQLLGSVGMENQQDKKIEELSKGMQQKIQFISAVIHDPDLIIIDEPFSGLDPLNTMLIKNILLSQKQAGRTIIVSTHMMEQAEALCDRLVMIDRGRLALYGSLGEVRKTYRSNSVMLEFEGNIRMLDGLAHAGRVVPHDGGAVEIFLKEGADTRALLEELIKRVGIIRFEPSIPSLNDIFIKVVRGAGQ